MQESDNIVSVLLIKSGFIESFGEKSLEVIYGHAVALNGSWLYCGKVRSSLSKFSGDICAHCKMSLYIK